LWPQWRSCFPPDKLNRQQHLGICRKTNKVVGQERLTIFQSKRRRKEKRHQSHRSRHKSPGCKGYSSLMRLGSTSQRDRGSWRMRPQHSKIRQRNSSTTIEPSGLGTDRRCRQSTIHCS
jgi:hypothetical protein